MHHQQPFTFRKSLFATTTPISCSDNPRYNTLSPQASSHISHRIKPSHPQNDDEAILIQDDMVNDPTISVSPQTLLHNSSRRYMKSHKQLFEDSVVVRKKVKITPGSQSLQQILTESKRNIRIKENYSPIRDQRCASPILDNSQEKDLYKKYQQKNWRLSISRVADQKVETAKKTPMFRNENRSNAKERFNQEVTVMKISPNKQTKESNFILVSIIEQLRQKIKQLQLGNISGKSQLQNHAEVLIKVQNESKMLKDIKEELIKENKYLDRQIMQYKEQRQSLIYNLNKLEAGNHQLCNKNEKLINNCQDQDKFIDKMIAEKQALQYSLENLLMGAKTHPESKNIKKTSEFLSDMKDNESQGNQFDNLQTTFQGDEQQQKRIKSLQEKNARLQGSLRSVLSRWLQKERGMQETRQNDRKRQRQMFQQVKARLQEQVINLKSLSAAAIEDAHLEKQKSQQLFRYKKQAEKVKENLNILIMNKEQEISQLKYLHQTQLTRQQQSHQQELHQQKKKNQQFQLQKQRQMQNLLQVSQRQLQEQRQSFEGEILWLKKEVQNKVIGLGIQKERQMRQERWKLMNEMRQLKLKKDSEIQSLKLQKQRPMRQLQERKQREKEDLRIEYSNLQQQINLKLFDREHQIKKLQYTIKDINTELQILRANSQHHQALINTLQQDKQLNINKREALKAELTHLSNQNEQLQADLSTQKREVESLRGEVEKLRQLANQLQGKQKDHAQQLQQSKMEVSRLQVELEGDKRLIQDMRTKAMSFQQQLNVLRLKNESGQQEIGKYKMLILSYKQSLRKREETKEEQWYQMTKLYKQQIGRLEQDIKILADTHDGYSKKFRRMNSTEISIRGSISSKSQYSSTIK